MRYESAKTVNGNIGVSYSSQAEADARATAMDAGNNFNCSYCSGCSYCSRCSYCSYCSDCSGCSYCSDCSRCSDCSGALKWTGQKAASLMSLNGLRWPVSCSDTHMQIGCQNHSHEDWAAFDDQAITKMSPDALDFWRQWKSTLMAMCESRRGRQ